MNKRRPKEEHIDELNGMTMEGKENEGKRKLMRNGVWDDEHATLMMKLLQDKCWKPSLESSQILTR